MCVMIVATFIISAHVEQQFSIKFGTLKHFNVINHKFLFNLRSMNMYMYSVYDILNRPNIF